MTGRADETGDRRVGDVPPRARTAVPGSPERAGSRTEERTRGAAGIAERHAMGTGRETERIREEIEQTRDDMSETIDAIQDRLRPRNVAANAAEGVRDAASSAADRVRDAVSDTYEGIADSRVVHEVRSNPVPAVMVGVGIVGLAWLAFGGWDRGRRRRTEVYDHGTSFGYYEQRDDYDRGRPRSAYGSTGPVAGRAGEVASRAGEVASRTGEYAREASARARHTTRRAQSQLQRAMNENPLAVGAAALAVGAIIGMALPETEPENEWLGEARDNVVEGAQDMARTAANRVQEAASDAANRVKDVVSDPAALLNKNQ